MIVGECRIIRGPGVVSTWLVKLQAIAHPVLVWHKAQWVDTTVR
jgi:hypothetical protein